MNNENKQAAPSVTVDTPEFDALLDGYSDSDHSDYQKRRSALITHIDARTAQAVADAFEAGKQLAHEQACKVTHALMDERDAALWKLAALPAQQQPAQAALSYDVRDLIGRTVDRLNKAQIFPLAAEWRAILAATQQLSAEPVAIAEPMPGSSGFTIAVFKAVDVPVGTKVFITPPAPARQANEWQEAERIRDLPLVDEVLQGFADDRTGDNAAMVVWEVMRAVAPPAPAQQDDGELPALPFILIHAIEMVDACMDVTQVEPEDAAAWQIVRKHIATRLPAQQDAKPLTDADRLDFMDQMGFLGAWPYSGQFQVICHNAILDRQVINGKDARTAIDSAILAAAEGGV